MTSPPPPAEPDPAAGVFETIRAQGGEAHLLEGHLARLRASVRALYGARLGDELEGRVADVLRTAADGVVTRLRVLARPSTGDGVDLQAGTAPLGAAAARTTVQLRAWTVPGGLGAHKWADRRAIDAASARLGATPLLVEPGGDVLEAAWGNVWALEGDRLVTPPADGRILPGVTRAHVLAVAGELGLRAAEEQLSLERLRRADALFVTSSLRLAVPASLGGEDGGAAEPADLVTAALLRRTG
jgi:para-aminobenzoate synthetase / 4-amino-4-deoxychorismate lyase